MPEVGLGMSGDAMLFLNIRKQTRRNYSYIGEPR